MPGVRCTRGRLMAISQKTRRAVFARDEYTCQYCGWRPKRLQEPAGMWSRKKSNLHVDHMYPRSKGGHDRIENYVTACEYCNLSKRNKILDLIPVAYCCGCERLQRKPEGAFLCELGAIWKCSICTMTDHINEVFYEQMWEETGIFSDLALEQQYYDKVITDGWDVAA